MNGVINVYKEAGYTSHDVVAKLRGILRQRKIGHTGTLDPDAVGVLPVCIGNATKLCDMLTEDTKEYEALLLLGVETDTQDMSGQVLQTREVSVTADEAEEAILSFTGEYEQIPPMYSALKVNGKKLYELARAGKTVERKARKVTIGSIKILDMELPSVRILVSCSKGTYIRTLCHDIGRKLGTGGTMQTLCRTRAGTFCIKDALTLKQIEEYRNAGVIEQHILPVDSMFRQFRAVTVKEAFQKLVVNGNPLLAEQTASDRAPDGDEKVRIYDEAGEFYGIYQYRQQEQRFKPVKMFLGQG